jgi:hypothetical protein
VSWRRAVLALAAIGLMGPVTAFAADLRRVESVGVVAVDEDDSGSSTHRDLAVGAAVARAVERVAKAVLPNDWSGGVSETDEEPGEGEIAPGLAPALGSDPFEYATRFRIVEDRGIRPALLSRSDAETEYVVLVEVFVDAGRIEERLAAVGWTDDPSGAQATRVRLVLEGLDSFEAYDALRRTLVEELRVRSAVPLEFSRGRAVLAVDGDYGPEALLAALVDSTEPGLRVVPVRQEAETLTVLVDWTAPLAPAERSAPPPAEQARDAD